MSEPTKVCPMCGEERNVDSRAGVWKCGTQILHDGLPMEGAQCLRNQLTQARAQLAESLTENERLVKLNIWENHALRVLSMDLQAARESLKSQLAEILSLAEVKRRLDGLSVYDSYYNTTKCYSIQDVRAALGLTPTEV